MAESHPRQEVASGINPAYTKQVSFDSLWYLYVEERLSRTEIGKILGLTPGEVRNKLVTFGIFRPKEIKFSRHKIKTLYHKRGLSISDLADELSVGTASISRHLRYFGLNKSMWQLRNQGGGPGYKYCSYRTNTEGYEVWSTPGGGTYSVHRLVAVAEYGIDEVANKQVHHINGVKWDNRPGNLEPISAEKHAEHSNKKSAAAFLRKYNDAEVAEILRMGGYGNLTEYMSD